jgi:hypothetical protein
MGLARSCRRIITRRVPRDHGAPRVPAFWFPFPCPSGAAPKSAMSSRHHGEARCDRRSRLGARCRCRGTRRRKRCGTDCSLARRRQRWVRYHANHGGRSRGVRREVATALLTDGMRAKIGASFLVPHAMPNCDDYCAIMQRAERRTFHRAKDMN